MKNDKDDNNNPLFPLSVKSPLRSIPIRDADKGIHLEDQRKSLHPNREFSLLSTFIYFLAYRSVGNPKRFNELLSSFMVSADRAIPDIAAREGFHCQDVLYLPDHKIMRIQLIARIYQHLNKGFADKVRSRDDKAIVSLIYLSDFLFKFHDRAFSWESLELIDELVHMHRGHDLRLLLHDLVEHYSDRYLHRITNGMYSYRFRSYFANEVEYLTRHSDEEMAAFKFTLDESQTLRDHLNRQLDQGDNRDKTDILSMLGELHELYQEYEMSRQYYRRCINAWLPELIATVGKKMKDDKFDIPVLFAIHSNANLGKKALVALLQWGPITLKLFLKIAMTFERAGNYSAALIRYERCIGFGENIIAAFAANAQGNCDDNGRDNGNHLNAADTQASTSEIPATRVFEYLGLLFEPLFSYAWLLNKNPHTSVSALRVVKDVMNSMLDKHLKNNRYGFITSQLYKKAGALYFYSGFACGSGSDERSVDKALIYYRESAKKLSAYFRNDAKAIFTKHDNNSSLFELLSRNPNTADFNLSIAKCLSDLSDALIAGVGLKSLFGGECFCSGNDIVKDYGAVLVNMVGNIDEWFYNKNYIYDGECLLDFISKDSLGSSHDSDLGKLNLSLDLSFAASIYLLRAGYIESAAREAMHTVEVISQYFDWFWLMYITQVNDVDFKNSFTVFRAVLQKIVWYIDYLPWVFSSVRSVGVTAASRPESSFKKNTYYIVKLIPTSALTSLASVGLSLSMFLAFPDFDNGLLVDLRKIHKAINQWTGSDESSANDSYYWYTYFEQTIIRSLRRHRYPVLNQLNALKTLVDASLIKCYVDSLRTNSSGDKNKSVLDNTRAWLQELYFINEKYNHPLHFTPIQSGLTLYLYEYLKNNNKLDLPTIDNFNIYAETHRLLVQSIDMCHMGRGYYAAIDKMYYLFDDFNDSQIHRNHAMQMAGTQLVKEALIELRTRGFNNILHSE